MKAYKRWYLLFIFISLATLTSVAVLCYFVNPYKIYYSPNIEHVNVKKIENKEYLLKARQVAAIKPDIIFIGSSRTRVGLDPDYFYQLTGSKVYNLGLSGANIYEQMRYFDYALFNNPNIKRVIIGLDFEGFNEFRKNRPVYNDSRLDTRYMIKDDLLNTLLSEQAVKDSIKVLLDNVRSQQNYTRRVYLPDGSHNEDELLARHMDQLKHGHNRFFDHLNEQLQDAEVLKNYKLSNEKVDNYKRIVNICRERNIQLDVFIPPVHALQAEGIRKLNLWEEFEDWKREMVAITPLWDFSGYNSITSTPPSNFDYYLDQSHYRKNVGNLVLNKILNVKLEEVSEDFGMYLTSENIENHLSNIRQDRIEWAKKNNDIVKKIEDL
ncbi:hypothetical protein FZW96_07745 [Bacillus sp. BGMRC 2118]|nr:hypothetical protein FZW96_07745 [Bacillus sp. BGMRC 2118]